ncbi:NmrA family NAD(P)-binding protein [Streptomyces sp. enrichment culture]|uniref:NmrA family NAD(P)-binding protein n=1 Tax=Streptomyces sp. enrichment culture TaxID=1795815 RepID=UPI003F54518B
MNETHTSASTSPRHAKSGNDLFVVTAATSDTGASVVRALLDSGSPVVAVGRDAERLKPYAERGARTHVSPLDDADRLSAALDGATGAFIMLAPGILPSSTDFQAYQRSLITAQARAVQEAHQHGSLRRVVTLSGWAANHPGARGPVWGLKRLEEAIDATGVPAVHLRAGSFMENLRADIASIKATGSTGGLVPADLPLPMIATADIGRVAAEFLRGDRAFECGPVEVAGPAYRTLAEATQLIGAALGVKNARYEQRSPQAVREALIEAGFSEHMADGTVEMTLDVAEGRIRLLGSGTTITTGTTLEQFLAAATT